MHIALRIRQHRKTSVASNARTLPSLGLSLARLLALAFACSALSSEAFSQCVYKWKHTDGYPSTPGQVSAIIEWDPDGSGPRGKVIVAGGNFDQIGSQWANNVATFDPSTSTWSPLGDLNSDSNARVSSLLIDGTNSVVAAGTFVASAGTETLRIARWNGSSWNAMGAGFNNTVNALVLMPNGEIVAGGNFTHSGTTVVNGIARWNGTAWLPLGSGVTGPNSPAVFALSVSPSGQLIAAGRFNSAGGASANFLAQWNGQSWSAVDSGPAPTGTSVTKLQHLANGHLIAAGNFAVINALGTTTSSIARWDGASWWPLGSGVNNSVQSLSITSDGSLFVTGAFTVAGGVSVVGLAQWNGATWTAVSPIPFSVPPSSSTSFTSSEGKLYLGISSGIFEWTGTAVGWLEPGRGFLGDLLTLFPSSDGGLIAGGRFRYRSDPVARWIAKWNGDEWAALGTNLNGPVVAIAERSNGELFIAGNFSLDNGPSELRVARWSGSDWVPVGGAMDQEIKTLAIAPNGDVVVGGYFTTIGGVPITHVARWDGTAWSSVGTTQPEPPESLVVAPDGSVIIAASRNETGVFRSNGGPWERVDAVLRPSAGAWAATELILLPNGQVATSLYYSLLGVNTGRVATFDGTNWTFLGAPFGTVGQTSPIDAIGALPDSRIAVVGAFASIGSSPINRMAMWDGGVWKQLPPNIFGAPMTIAGTQSGDIAVGGSIQVREHGHWRVRFALLQCRCAADVDDDGDFTNGGTPDDAVTIDDLLFFLVGFEQGDLEADTDNGAGLGIVDEAVTIEDLLFFLNRLEAGC